MLNRARQSEANGWCEIAFTYIGLALCPETGAAFVKYVKGLLSLVEFTSADLTPSGLLPSSMSSGRSTIPVTDQLGNSALGTIPFVRLAKPLFLLCFVFEFFTQIAEYFRPP